MICHKWNISKNIVIILPLSVFSTSVLIKNLTSHTVHWYEHQVRYLSTRMGVHLPILIFCLLLLCGDLEAAVNIEGNEKVQNSRKMALAMPTPTQTKESLKQTTTNTKKSVIDARLISTGNESIIDNGDFETVSLEPWRCPNSHCLVKTEFER